MRDNYSPWTALDVVSCEGVNTCDDTVPVKGRRGVSGDDHMVDVSGDAKVPPVAIGRPCEESVLFLLAQTRPDSAAL